MRELQVYYVIGMEWGPFKMRAGKRKVKLE